MIDNNNSNNALRFLITGANGYLGRGIVKELLDRGNAVTACSIGTDGIDLRADVVKTDIFDIDDELFFNDFDVLLHLAWRDGFNHNSDSHINDLPKHCRFIELASKRIKRICIMGSMHEIGYYEGEVQSTTPCNPLSFYGIAKNALRQAATLICKNNNSELQWLRGYYIVNNDSKGNSIFSKIAQAAEDGKKKFPFTSGIAKYDFMNYKDFCVAVSQVVSQDEINGIINICSGQPESLASRVEAFIVENDYDINLEYGVYPDRAYDSPAIWGNPDLLKIIKGV